ncbi:hypothetical protein MyChFU_33830 [Mycobacterium intracellulare subsp. chimaera]
MAGGHVRVTGQRFDVQRLRVVAVDSVPDAAQQNKGPQPLRRRVRSAGHPLDAANPGRQIA